VEKERWRRRDDAPAYSESSDQHCNERERDRAGLFLLIGFNKTL